jgi:hypothetical protein
MGILTYKPNLTLYDNTKFVYTERVVAVMRANTIEECKKAVDRAVMYASHIDLIINVLLDNHIGEYATKKQIIAIAKAISKHIKKCFEGEGKKC